MIYNGVYQSLNTLSEYLVSCNFSVDYVETTPTSGKFTYDSTLECVHLNSDGAKSRFFELVTQPLKIGDEIEIEVEIMNVGGVDLGKIIIVDLANASNYYQVLSNNNTNQFKKMKFTHIVRHNSSFKVGVGFSNGASGNIKIRNFKVNTKSSYNNSTNRKVVLEGHNNFAKKFNIRNDFSVDPCTLSVGIEGIVVKWSDPLNGKRPVPTVAMDYVGNSPKYITRVGGVTNQSLIVRFYSVETGLLVNSSDLDLTNSIFVYVSCSS